MSLDKQKYARAFGLPGEQVRLFHELTAKQIKSVGREFSFHRTTDYVYAVKRSGGLVGRRLKIDGREVKRW